MIKELAARPVRLIRSPEAMSVTADVTARATIRRMAEQRCGAVLVVDAGGLLIGIFTERDVLRRSLGDDPGWQDRAVGDLMTGAPVAVHDEDTLEEALGRMQSGRFRHLPVVDAAGRPLGMVSIRDVLTTVAEHFPKHFVNLPPEPSREPGSLYGG